MDSYLENAMDYVQSTFENANEWLKAHDPLKFPEVEAVCIAVSVGGGPYVGGPGCNSGSGGNGLGAPAASSSYSGGGGSNSFSPSFGNTIAFGQSVDRFESARHDTAVNFNKHEIYKQEDNRIIHKFDHMGNIVNPNFPNIYITPSTPEQGSSEESKQGDNKEQKQQQCITTNQKLVFANAAYYSEKKIGDNQLLKGNGDYKAIVWGAYENDRLGTKVAIIFQPIPIGVGGVWTFNIAGTADPTEEGLENYMKDMLNNVLIGSNSLQGILKDRVDWYIKEIEHKNYGNEPVILNGHSSGGFEALIIAALRPDLVSQVNMVDSPGGYDMILKLMNGDIAKVNELYKKVEIYNGNRGFVNSKGSNPPGKVIHHIPVDVHSIKEFATVFKTSGDQKILGRCHSDSLCNYKDGEYKVERLRDGVTKKEIADYFGLSESQIEAIDNNSLSDKDLAKFQNKISSKFKFKLSHERSQKEQCIY